MLESNPKWATENISSVIAKNAPVIAPADLLIRKAKFKTTQLDNGDTVRVISGSLINKTSEKFRMVNHKSVLYFTGACACAYITECDQNSKQKLSWKLRALEKLIALRFLHP